MGPLSRARARLESGDAVVAGVLSGTSADGIDVVLTRFPAYSDDSSAHRRAATLRRDVGPPATLAFETRPFPGDLRRRLRCVLDRPTEVTPPTLATLSRDLGLAFGGAVRAAVDELDCGLDLVGSHGQTVFHHDGSLTGGRATMQLGEGAFVAEAAGAPVASDFRQADVAAGGEGAPLSALADELLFHEAARPLAILNLGGMANLTLLGERPEDIRAFDTGPAGSLLDGLARRLLDRPFDEGGRRALDAEPSGVLVDEFLAHPFFDRSPPKSTGRDTFGEAWVETFAARARELSVAPASILASAVDLVARSIAHALERFSHASSLPPAPVGTLALAGGGGRNEALVRALVRHTGMDVASSSALGVDPDAREALVFAVLAARCLLEIPSTRTAVTGARGGRILGSTSAPASFFSEAAPSRAAADSGGAAGDRGCDSGA